MDYEDRLQTPHMQELIHTCTDHLRMELLCPTLNLTRKPLPLLSMA